MAPDARLWRFDAQVYAEPTGYRYPGEVPDGAGLAVTQLRDSYHDHRAPLHEERILDALLSDLRQAYRLTVT